MYERHNKIDVRLYPYAEDAWLRSLPKKTMGGRQEYDAETGQNMTPNVQEFRSHLTILNSYLRRTIPIAPAEEFQDTRPLYQKEMDETDIAFQLASVYQHPNFHIHHVDPARRPLYFLNFNMDDPDQEPIRHVLRLDIAVQDWLLSIAHNLHIPSMGWELGVYTRTYAAPGRVSNVLNAIGIGWATHSALPIKHPKGLYTTPGQK